MEGGERIIENTYWIINVPNEYIDKIGGSSSILDYLSIDITTLCSLLTVG